jgi:UDP-N-acetylglucosamine--N-acetylmuramyl-(pentapeptide) pyrophosphoryl-undecaprenol N-acetylglucosamine transferase
MRLLIAGGGTGGHLYPGIAIAEEIVARPGGEVLFVGTARGLETKLVPAAGFALELLDVSGLNRVGATAMMRGLARLPRALMGAGGIVRRFRPDLVMGVGGYASGPVVLAAALLGYPTAIQEQNSHPGITNRILGRWVRRVFIAFDHARAFFAEGKTSLCGNPVRRRFLAGASRPARPTDDRQLAGNGSRVLRVLRVLIVGGSQGARAVNDLVLGAVAELANRDDVRWLHQTGPSDEARVRQRYAELHLPPAVVAIRPFIDDMPAALHEADLVIARAGALTLAELAIVGRAAILIPLPTAAGDHQTRNAAELERAGAAVVLAERTCTPSDLARTVKDLLGDESRRNGMATAMARLARPAAAREIVDALEAIVALDASVGGAR